jgi:hypothetical protein
LALYPLTQLWLILFKLSYDIPAILTDHQTSSFNLIPFTLPTAGRKRSTGAIELQRRIARGFTNRENYRLRMLLIG